MDIGENGDMDAAGVVLNQCFQLIDLYARVSAPFIPGAAEKMRAVFVDSDLDLSWPDEYAPRVVDGAKFVVPENLFSRIDDETVAKLTAQYAPKSDDTPKPIVAKIVAVKNHPTRDDLHILTVDDGKHHDLQIVCGAPNVRDGMIGVLAPVGTVLPGQKKPIAQRTVAGVESYGMMCSSVEIGVGDDDKNIIELPDDAQIGTVYNNK